MKNRLVMDDSQREQLEQGLYDLIYQGHDNAIAAQNGIDHEPENENNIIGNALLAIHSDLQILVGLLRLMDDRRAGE